MWFLLWSSLLPTFRPFVKQYSTILQCDTKSMFCASLLISVSTIIMILTFMFWSPPLSSLTFPLWSCECRTLLVYCNSCATMAKQHPWVTEPTVLLIIVMVVLMALPPAAEADMGVIFFNNLNHDMVMMHCDSNLEGPKPGHFFAPYQSYWAFSLLDKGGDTRHRNFGGAKYWCKFEAAGKPTTTVTVFYGTGGSSNQPCGCTGIYCHWTINEEGMTCGDGYIQKWG